MAQNMVETTLEIKGRRDDTPPEKVPKRHPVGHVLADILKVYTTQPIGKFGDDSGWSTIVLLTLSCGDYQKGKKQ